MSNGYRLITNEEAISLGKQALGSLLDSVDTSTLQVFNILMPGSRSYCHVDLLHQDYEINVWKSEVYLPYLRVTNSYNRTRGLRFDIGFLRKVCDNGMIFEQETVKFKFNHTARELTTGIRFETDYDRLKRLEEQFRGYVKGLLRCKVPNEQMLPLMATVLDLRFDLAHSKKLRAERERKRLEAFRQQAGDLAERYADELGTNAYAVFNALTEYVSRPEESGLSAVRVDPLQKRIGRWANTFPQESSAWTFSLKKYTADHQAYFN